MQRVAKIRIPAIDGKYTQLQIAKPSNKKPKGAGITHGKFIKIGGIEIF
jgi:hypothetical protein